MPIVDSHIHLFGPEHYETLAWMTETHPLRASHSVSEYLTCTDPELEGFIFVETDRVHLLPQSGGDDFAELLKWPLEEFRYICAIAKQSKKLLGAVPWAPVPLGGAAMKTWYSLVEGDKNLVCGVRYLVQDKPAGTMSQPLFKDGIIWALEHELAFDLGVDVRSGGLWQLEEAVQCIKDVLQVTKSRANIVINHLGKPDLGIPPGEARQHSTFTVWRENLAQLAQYGCIFVKLSGVFSELPSDLTASLATDETDAFGLPVDAVETIVSYIRPWVVEVVKLFGASRVMWGSDWPVCNVGFEKLGGKPADTWKYWQSCTNHLLSELVKDGALREEELNDIWSATAKRAYGIKQ